ncbi:MAG: hypothetical protein WCK84_04395 [Bacteroidota bacterium]
MTRVQSLVLLVNSMTLSEKKAFRIKSCRARTEPNYIVLYDAIEKNGSLTIAALRKKFLNHRPGASFETSAGYLFELLLHSMLGLRLEQDSFYGLFNKISEARILYEKSLFNECFELLNEVMAQAEKYENYYALLLASRLELEYLLSLNFPNLSEKALLKKQFKLNEYLKYLRKINEQSSLFEILKHRVVYKGHPRSPKQKNELNDLVFSELSLVASQNLENFEIRKLHQLFQSNYLINVGDYKSALHSYYELNTLFEANKHLWSTPPVYYLNMIEGVLESLRGIRNYQGMSYFIDQLNKIKSTSVDFRINLTCLTFQYELFPFLDTGDFYRCLELMKHYKISLYDKFSSLDRVRQTELCLYTSLVYLGISEFHKAHKFLNQIFISVKNFSFLPIYRTVRLVNLIILYSLGDFDLIKYEIRSMKRDLSGTDKGYKIERFLFRFLSKSPPAIIPNRKKHWDKIRVAYDEMHNDVFEQQILRIFDFTAWLESQIRKIPLSEILKNKMNPLSSN